MTLSEPGEHKETAKETLKSMKGPQKVAQVPLKKKSCLEGHEANVVFMSDKNQKTVPLTKVL